MAEQQGGKYGSLIRQAKQTKPDDQPFGLPDGQITSKPDNQTTGQPDANSQVKEKQVNLCVKVPESLRRHWAIQAKIQDITMTDVMVEALTQKFGLPDDQTTR
ncbi:MULTISPECIES: hypothetical protein [Cyanophyceae]|uniref:Plasmid segregation centromere-binding protein ParG n=1 Tax=Leptolyngbya subtilissima DQ-A4 TaxID=2933933 RepID=A0ABV0KBM7_9CYAN|nr:hypothetical protein [Nodosilinea sp. FACHB-141]MBD2114924.1 hypothetical protein [Nodosilinea sp. FACHB-141]